MTAFNNNTIELNENDVVCGRGGLANKHPGNRMLRRICSENKELYQSSINPTHKQCLIASILMAIQQHGGRFVARTKNGRWEEISDKKAKEKTAQLLRESDSPILSCSSIVSKPVTMAQTKPVVTFDSSSNDYFTQTTTTTTTTTAPQIKNQPMIIPPEPPLIPSILNAQYMGATAAHPETIPSNNDYYFMQQQQQQQGEPASNTNTTRLLLPVPPAPVAPVAPVAPAAPKRAFDDGDLFDLIPLEAAVWSNYGSISNDPELFQDLCQCLSVAC